MTAPVSLLWASMGNNIGLSLEQARRSIRIQMVAKTDRPFERTTFRPRLPEWSTEHRGDLVHAALTLALAWLAAGCPSGPRTLGSFEVWARVMGGILDVAGIAGFLGNTEDLYATADFESASWRALLTAWLEVYSTTKATTAMIHGLPPAAELFDFKSPPLTASVRSWATRSRRCATTPSVTCGSSTTASTGSAASSSPWRTRTGGPEPRGRRPQSRTGRRSSSTRSPGHRPERGRC